MQVAMAAISIFQTVGSIVQGYQQKKAANAEANMKIASAEQKVALDKANAESDSLDRFRKLRAIVGQQRADNVAAGGGAFGSVNFLGEDSGGQFARDAGITDFNLRSSSSAYLTSAQADANQLRAQGSNAVLSGWMKGLSSFGDYAYKQYQRGY